MMRNISVKNYLNLDQWFRRRFHFKIFLEYNFGSNPLGGAKQFRHLYELPSFLLILKSNKWVRRRFF